ncbi:MAG: hypothetical protein IJM59_02260 [Proteobacteria bacterium]|nr:hypothetical protein [Pseudomonadota bacterium]
MKKGIFGGLVMALWLAVTPAWAEGVDSVTWLQGDYVGVGGIEVPKFVQRRIYTYLMNFFVTDKAAKQAFDEIRAAGIVLEDILTRIVVGVPVDVERAEHIILWETSEDLSKYKVLLSAHSQIIDTRSHQGVEYFATKRENECLAILGSVLVLGSELRVKEVIEAHKAGYKDGPKRAALQAELKRVNRKMDAWFVFALTDKERKTIGRADPLIDMTAGGLGTLKLADIQKGHVVFDFSKGLSVSSSVEMVSEASAAQTARLMTAVLQDAGKDQDVKDLGFDSFVSGISFESKKSDVILNVNMDQPKFDELISQVTQIAKSVSGKSVQEKKQVAAEPAPAQPTQPSAPAQAAPKAK